MPTRDPWGTEIAIECTGAAITVRSAGPDKQFHTTDDLLIPRKLRRSP